MTTGSSEHVGQKRRAPLPPVSQVTFIAVSPARVYAALTSAAEWDAWFTSGMELEARPGGFIRFRWRDFGPDSVTLEDGGPVLAAVPGELLSFQWCPGSSPTTVTIRLEARDTGTRVTLTETGYHDTDEDMEAALHTAAGWGEAMTLFKMYLEHGIGR